MTTITITPRTRQNILASVGVSIAVTVIVGLVGLVLVLLTNNTSTHSRTSVLPVGEATTIGSSEVQPTEPNSTTGLLATGRFDVTPDGQYVVCDNTTCLLGAPTDTDITTMVASGDWVLTIGELWCIPETDGTINALDGCIPAL